MRAKTTYGGQEQPVKSEKNSLVLHMKFVYYLVSGFADHTESPGYSEPFLISYDVHELHFLL